MSINTYYSLFGYDGVLRWRRSQHIPPKHSTYQETYTDITSLTTANAVLIVTEEKGLGKMPIWMFHHHILLDRLTKTTKIISLNSRQGSQDCNRVPPLPRCKCAVIMLKEPARFLSGVWSKRNSIHDSVTSTHNYIQTPTVYLQIVFIPLVGFSQLKTIISLGSISLLVFIMEWVCQLTMLSDIQYLVVLVMCEWTSMEYWWVRMSHLASKFSANRVKLNVKFTLEQAMKAQRGSRVIALLFL